MRSAGTAAAVAVRAFEPAALPSGHVPTRVGTPATVDVGAFSRVTPPLVTVIVTGTPPRIFPLASFTENEGAERRGNPAVPDNAATDGAIEAGGGGAVLSL